jgi:hypothetical protein
MKIAFFATVFAGFLAGAATALVSFLDANAAVAPLPAGFIAAGLMVGAIVVLGLSQDLVKN